MRERDIFEEIIDIGKRRGTLTYDEINDALPSEFFSPDEIEDLMDILQDMGVKVVDHEEALPPEEEMEEEIKITESQLKRLAELNKKYNDHLIEENEKPKEKENKIRRNLHIRFVFLTTSGNRMGNRILFPLPAHPRCSNALVCRGAAMRTRRCLRPQG